MPGLDSGTVTITVDGKDFELADALNGLYALADWAYCDACPIAECDGLRSHAECNQAIMAWALTEGRRRKAAEYNGSEPCIGA